MKKIQSLVLLFTFAFTNCITKDPIEGRNTFALKNMTQTDIQLAYKFSTDLGGWNAGKTDTVIVASKETNIFVTLYGGDPRLTPSRVLEQMVIMSLDNDTLYKMDVIDDSEWILTDTIKDYGYKVGYYHWLYEFSE